MKTVINIKADKEVKEQAVATARDMGIPLSTVINAFLKKFIREKCVVFTAPYTPTPAIAKRLKKSLKDVRTGRNLSPIFYDTKKMDAYLDALK